MRRSTVLSLPIQKGFPDSNERLMLNVSAIGLFINYKIANQ